MTLLELRDHLTKLLEDGVPADTLCVTDRFRSTGFRDVEPRRRRIRPAGPAGRYQADPTPGADSNALTL